LPVSHLLKASFPVAIGLSAIGTLTLKKPRFGADDPASYWPISTLNNISKLFERLFLTRLQSHVCASNNFSSVQSAYRRRYSTETAIYIPSIKSSNQGQPSLLVSLNVIADFDIIDDHSRLSC